MGRDVTQSSEPKDVSMKEDVIDGAPYENSNAKHDILDVKSSKLEDAKNDGESSEVEETKSSSHVKSGLEASPVEDVENIVQNSFDVTIHQHACASPEFKNKSPSINNLHSPSSSKKSLSNSSSASTKHLADEDGCSTASSTTASARTARTMTTLPVAPKFSVTERLEKRKEFYSKVEEKRKALEAEKREYEARNKEEQQAAIKQLRKTMGYKANPVPNFYYGGPPPKKEIKKVPTTRAVSPKLGRRKSCGDAASSLAEEKAASARAPRHSLGAHDLNPKQASRTPTNTPKKKGLIHEPSSKGSSKKERPKQLPKETSSTNEPSLDPATEPDSAPQSAPETAQAVPQDIPEPKIANLSCQ